MPPRKRLKSSPSSPRPDRDVKPSISPQPSPSISSCPFARPSDATYYSYQIGRGEQLVLTFEPYKSYLLPLWRFKTVPIAQDSSDKLEEKFKQFARDRDFVGMDMTRKFIQMVRVAVRFARSATVSRRSES